MSPSLAEEARAATDLLRGKEVKQVLRHRSGEVLVEFDDGTRLFVNASSGEVELSVTAGRLAEDSDRSP